MKVVSIIPVRLGSTRFPNKPLAEIAGIPMLAHCYHRSLLAKTVNDTYIATPDREIYDYATKRLGAKVIMTSSEHERATDRVAEALGKIERDACEFIDVPIVYQGDEPTISPNMMDICVRDFLDHREALCSNLASPISSPTELESPDVVKVVYSSSKNALYFSRSPLPYWGHGERAVEGSVLGFKQVCFMPFSRAGLMRFNSLKGGYLERIESIDMLRFVENECAIRITNTLQRTIAVDRRRDLERAEELMMKDPYFDLYRDLN